MYAQPQPKSEGWGEMGGSLGALQRFLGHASMLSTRRYARLADHALIEVLRPAKTSWR